MMLTPFLQLPMWRRDNLDDNLICEAGPAPGLLKGALGVVAQSEDRRHSSELRLARVG